MFLHEEVAVKSAKVYCCALRELRTSRILFAIIFAGLRCLVTNDVDITSTAALNDTRD